MMLKAKALESRELLARDGAIGAVKDVYFDDAHWMVRYFVVRAGSWLTGREVLISPAAITRTGAGIGQLETSLTREQVRNSPDVETDRPVSRQNEVELTKYYGWPYYWTAPALGTGYVAPIAPAAAPTAAALRPSMSPEDQPYGRTPETVAREVEAIGDQVRADPHLRSAHAVRGYTIEAIDGSIGHVEDFLVDDDGWFVRFVLGDTRNWLPGKTVVIPLNVIRSIDWNTGSLAVDLSRDIIKSAPEFDPDHRDPADYTDRLQAHYARHINGGDKRRSGRAE